LEIFQRGLALAARNKSPRAENLQTLNARRADPFSEDAKSPVAEPEGARSLEHVIELPEPGRYRYAVHDGFHRRRRWR
jgi:hypothetical protein